MKYFILLLAACGSLAAGLKKPSPLDIYRHAQVCEKAENIDVGQCRKAFFKNVREFMIDYPDHPISEERFWHTMKQRTFDRILGGEMEINYVLYEDDGDMKFKCKPSENCPGEGCLPISNLTSFCDEKGGCETCRHETTERQPSADEEEPANSATLKKRIGGALGNGSGNMTRAQ
ncbi:hypothetical protein X797_008437 [Metarhizium robertsii]|uniref:Uncharacterized protein n=1 Tax=Metarhizium robertsii TaxID=568076 RepID=A0A0A1URT3_9HYPO|nr:hypothetical protein X797_008437 [Metarhizium robertsii]